MVRKVLVLNGPNLNLLGTREPELYGRETLDQIGASLTDEARALGLEVDFRQSNSEATLVDWIQQARTGHGGIILNAGAYTHTSIAILDALRAFGRPIIEVHLSNVYRREDFRHHSYVSLAATGVIAGLGAQGYSLALKAMATLIDRT
ncbi:MAG: type II 3-dehydroquinate dehydratase [Alphaproteobacteria bacterium]|nr:type II 3-dehydroquinate dehydratase [Alphaproteobacteria bacterium]